MAFRKARTLTGLSSGLPMAIGSPGIEDATGEDSMLRSVDAVICT